VYVQLGRLLDVLLAQGKQDGIQEDLRYLRLSGYEDPGCGETGVGCPVIGPCDCDESFPGGDRGEDLEGFGELAGLVAAED
jgi:hypothetical protein